MSIVLFVLVLGVLIFVHELGHFLAAKRFGIRVDEFGLGFPPRIFSFRAGETSYSLNLIPFGGFVKIFGEQPSTEETINPTERERAFLFKPRLVQAAVLVAGVFFNLLLAWGLLTTTLLVGLPMPVAEDELLSAGQAQEGRLLIIEVAPTSPAATAGLQPGDEIVYLTTVDEEREKLTNPTAAAVQAFVRARPEEPFRLGYRRGNLWGEELPSVSEAVLTPTRPEEGGEALIGIAMNRVALRKTPFLSALWEGAELTGRFTYQTVLALAGMVRRAALGEGRIMESLTGPIGLVGLVGQAADLGLVFLLSLTALISINLAVVNLVPFPALDGGRLLFLLIEAVKRSPIRPRVANALNMAGFLLLLLLLLVISYFDISRLF